MDGVFGLHVNNKKMKFGICILSKNKIARSEHVLLSSKKEQRGLLSIDIGDDGEKCDNGGDGNGGYGNGDQDGKVGMVRCCCWW